MRTRKRKDSLDRYQEKGLRANCARPFTHAALANQNIPHGIESSTICQGCQFLELCRSGKGDYDYLQKRAIALQSKRLNAHPASLPLPKSLDPENGFDYGNTALIFEESELSFNTTKIVKVQEKDIKDTIEALAEKDDNNLFLSLKPLLTAIKKLIAEKQSNRYGIDGKTLKASLLRLIPSDIDLIKLKEALTPDLSFLDPISEMGESIADMPASVRKAFAEKDSNLAEKAENEALKQWLPEFIDSLQGKGYLSLNHGILSISFVDERFLAIINEAAKIIFLSATESIENLEAIIYPPGALNSQTDSKVININIEPLNDNPQLSRSQLGSSPNKPPDQGSLQPNTQRLTKQQAVNVVESWLKVKAQAFGNTYNEQVVYQYTTDSYRDKQLGKVGWLRRNNAYEIWVTPSVEPLGDVLDRGNEVVINIQARESVTRYQGGVLDPNYTRSLSGTYRFTLQLDDGIWKVANSEEIN